ncbi:MAG TPA: ATP-binding cassette domain-containing protein [Candidatus Hydrogenedentes bacterium]|nr:ATP-binding cassette domain-containing protein [Candidatus Hydrogenedentota bacterium]
METPLIQFQDVHKAFGSQEVLRGVTLDIQRGKVTTIIGRSGIGKSVLLKHVVGLMEPDHGAILLEGQNLLKLSRRAHQAMKSRFSYMFQQMALLDSLTVYENIALPLQECTKLPKGKIREKVMEIAGVMELGDTLAKYPSQLSGGMSKRVAFARALVTEPEIVLFDEPTTGLDPVRKSMVHNMIAQHQLRKGFTAVVVSHDIPEVFDITQKVAMLEEGIIIAEGSPDEIRENEDPRVSSFIEGKSNSHIEL